MTTTSTALHQALASIPAAIAVAVSGGVDSLTLAAVAHELPGRAVRMYHAVSPAVPAEATARTRALADTRGWSLDLFDAGEFADPQYRANPVDRCFFCKTNLYGSVAARLQGTATIVSGTNIDDLGEYRPGLDAARIHGVRHPFVEAGIDKAGVRAIAREIGLGDVADLPSSPCLSSRVETGIAIDPAMLAIIELVESVIRAALRPSTVRCRMRAAGLIVELDDATLAALDEEQRRLLVSKLGSVTDRVPSFAPYRNGSAFLRAHAA